MSSHHPFHDHASRPHVEGDFLREEVRLANRNSGILLEALRHDVTPTGMHYLLNHFDVPYVAGHDWKVRVGGHVKSPLVLSLDEIKRLPAKTVRVTMECAGNGRANLHPRRPSQPWLYEAVGTAEWTGTPLRNILEKVKLARDAVEVAFFGIDRGFDRGQEHDYSRSLTVAKAMEEDVLLVWAMNGAPLLPQHGYPLRLVVPGWYGMGNVKWLDRIEVMDKPFSGFQQTGTYLYKNRPTDAGIPVTTIRVKSLMVPPGIPDWLTRRRLVEKGRVEIFGRAWSGDGVPVTKVELGVSGSWREAELEPQYSKYAWRGWRAIWEATTGEHELACRATDANGDTQPLEPRWDNAGFGNNMVHKVQVTVR